MVQFIKVSLLFLEPPSWGEWSEWNECPVTCGGDSQSRTRECIPDTCDDLSACVGDDTESQDCGEECCPRKYDLILEFKLKHQHRKLKTHFQGHLEYDYN